MDAIGDLGLEDVRMSQPVRLGEILPGLMRQIAQRMQQRGKKWLSSREQGPAQPRPALEMPLSGRLRKK
jgi:hypothetical protein